MKHFRTITASCLAIIVTAIGIAVYNLAGLYNSEKKRVMDIVKECAANADLLEMISRMESGEKASQSFIRLNTFIEFHQQKEGRVAVSDTLNTSLASILRIGLEFAEGKQQTDFPVLDSIFREELHRHDLYPSKAILRPHGSDNPSGDRLWKSEFKIDPGHSPQYDIYVSPMPGKVLSYMWGIIIPVFTITILFIFLSYYLIYTVRKLKGIEKMKDDFTHNMTHELKTPIAVAYSAADSMLRYYDQSNEERNRKFLKIILQRLSYLAGMTEKILSVSMERFNTMKLNMEPVYVRKLVEEVADMIKLKTDKPLRIDIDIPESFSVLADSMHLGNVFTNLLDNAVKYSGPSVEISVKAVSDLITVTDNGNGIAKEYLPFIFDKFYRVNDGNRYDTGGYGLGLFYVKQIIGLLGWSIDVTSKPGQGTRFTIKTNCKTNGSE